MGSMAHCVTNNLYTMPQLRQSWFAIVVVGGDARAKVHSEIFLRLFYDHNFFDHRMVCHCGFLSECPRRGCFFALGCGEG